MFLLIPLNARRINGGKNMTIKHEWHKIIIVWKCIKTNFWRKTVTTLRSQSDRSLPAWDLFRYWWRLGQQVLQWPVWLWKTVGCHLKRNQKTTCVRERYDDDFRNVFGWIVMIQQAAVDKHAQYSPVVETFAFSIVTAPLYRHRATSNTVSPNMFSEQLT